MNWFYANAGQQAGPINDEEFERLARTGVIQPATLVWREGMTAWEPYAKVVPQPAVAAAPVPPGQVACSECGRAVLPEDAMQINGRTICAVCKPIYLQKLREGAPSAVAPVAGTARYGGFWIRVLAKIIDGIIVGVPIMILSFIGMSLLGVSFLGQTRGGPPNFSAVFASMGLQLGIQAVSLVLNGLYTVFFVYNYGATPGKMALGLRVMMSDGTRLTLGRAIGRYFAEMLSGLTCYIGYILAGFDAEKRSLHDHICNTRVVYK